MSNNRRDSGTSVLGKIAIGVIGVIGGLLIGKAIDQATKKQQEPIQQKITVDSGEYTKNIEDYDHIEQLMICPITNCIMRYPVIIIECGHTFQKQKIVTWVEKHKHCPLCKISTNTSSLRPNYQLQQVIAQYLKSKKEQRQAKVQQQKKQEKQSQIKNVSNQKVQENKQINK